MADNTPRYGFRYFSSGGHPCPKPIPMIVTTLKAFDPGSATAARLQPGDPVRILTAGAGIEHATAGGTAPASNIFGIMAGVGRGGKVFNTSISTNGVMHPSKFIPSGVNYGTNLENQTIAMVIPCAGVTWEVDSNDTEASLAVWQAMVDLNADLAYDAPAAGSLDANPTLATGTLTTATAQWRIVGVSPTAMNQDYTGANVKMLVTINETQESPHTVVGTIAT